MNNKHNIIIFFAIFALYCGTSNTCHGHSVFQFTTFPFYEDEGAFVESPTEVGGVVGFFIGFPPAFILGSPGLLFGWEDYSNYAGLGTLVCIGQPISFLFGTPSYILKKIFWDGPIFLWNTPKYISEATSSIGQQEEERVIPDCGREECGLHGKKREVLAPKEE